MSTYKMTLRRKMTISSWDAPREGNIYGKLVLNMDKVLDFIDDWRLRYGEKLTVTHVLGKAIGDVLGKMPDMNGQIILGTYRQHKRMDLTFLVQIDGGEDLSKVTIEAIDQKDLHEIAAQLSRRSKTLRGHQDVDYEKSKKAMRLIPTWIMKPLLSVTGYITGVLGIGLPFLGLKSYPFGSCIVTSVGMLGLDEAFAPPTPFARVPFYVVLPAIKRRPVVEGDEIVIRSQLDVNATLDHRFIDGYQGGQ